jgi:microcystin degradation protein MlrC
MHATPRFTVLSAELLHETNTFCALPTTLASFAERGLLHGEQAIAARQALNTELGGFLEAAREHGWAMVHTVSAHAQPGGRVTRQAFDELVAPILAAAQAQVHAGRLDGILLALHGAMVTETREDGEGELLARLRRVVGPRVPIAITLDPHANVTRQMCDLANIMVSFKTYPHTDMRVAGRHAADILQRTMAGEIKPRTLRVSRPLLEEANSGRTDIGPMVQRIAQAREYETTPDVFAVSVNGGFANADIAEVGPSVVITAQGDMAAHARFAQGLADDMWACRSERINQFHTVAQAAALCHAHALSHTAGRGPIVVADYADNPGAGAYGDSTALLEALLQEGVKDACFGALIDPETVQLLMGHAVGDEVQVRLGGKTDARFGGAPLALTGRLLLLSDGHYVGSGTMLGGLKRSWGPTAVLQVQGITILVASHRAQMLDLEQFKAFGIHPEQKRIVAVKSMQHFRAAFEPIASQVIVCDSGALATLDYAQLPFARRPRPLFPFEQDIDIQAWLASHEQGLYLPGRA